MTQKELKELYQKEAAAYWKDKSMTDYCVKKAAYIVELEDGKYTIIDKPTISKDFCFGYGYCGVSTEEDYQEADQPCRGSHAVVHVLSDGHVCVSPFLCIVNCPPSPRASTMFRASWSDGNR